MGIVQSVALLALWMLAPVEVDLLVVGGGESAVAAAVQGARLKVPRVAIVNDIDWWGGQFSAEGVGAVDEWTLYRGRRVNFPRSGIFLEVMRSIREYNGRVHGNPSPGNAFTATDTIEPAAAAKIFAALLDQHKDRIRTWQRYQPVEVHRAGNRVTGVTFSRGAQRLRVNAKVTIDASDWGDVIRLSGAKYAAGPDARSRFGESNAPEVIDDSNRNEMNPLTWCIVARKSVKPAAPPPAPGELEQKALAYNMKLFVDTDYPEGTYSGNASVYTHRRLVDHANGASRTGPEKVLLNFPVNDYPLYQFPQRVVDELEKLAVGASKKNIVDMTTRERDVVFADAKRRSMEYFRFLQSQSPHFAALELTDEFGTADRLPWKPYIREGLRLEALYMMKEQDLKEQRQDRLGWARFMPEDNVFGFQFNIDFHPTRRAFLAGPDGPWKVEHTENRNWSTHTDRGGFPYRSLVPLEMDGLLGAGRSLGVSSIVSSAIRLHGQTMMAGQAAATAAAIAVRDKLEPRALVGDKTRLQELQLTLVRGVEGKPGVILWPYHDLTPDHRHFEAANMLAVRGVLPGLEDSLDFEAWRPVNRGEMYQALLRARLPFTAGRGEGNRPATWRDLYEALKAAGKQPSEGLAKVDNRLKEPSPVLYRFELAIHLWHALRQP